MASLTVGAMSTTTGDQIMEQDSATGKYKAKSLQNQDAIVQNFRNEMAMNEGQGYRGTLRGDSTRGPKWKALDDNDPEPGLLGSFLPREVIAMSLALKGRRVPGVTQILDVDVVGDQEDRVNRHAHVQLKFEVGGDDFPVVKFVSFGMNT